ncbi:MAG: Uncharacterised protein [Opitutia bacterium UBA7350]|nr:MAG: Uncharacterised protein [Opitutae bacterium UBA7350]
MNKIKQRLCDWFVRWQAWPLSLRCFYMGFCTLLAGLFFCVDLPEIKHTQTVENGPFLRFAPLQAVSQYDAISEQAMLFDTAPLFIPTRWSFAQQKLPSQSVAIPAGFEDFEPLIELLSQMSAGDALEADSGLVQSPLDMLGPSFLKLFSGNSGLSELKEPFPDPVATAYYRSVNAGWLRLAVLPSLDTVSPLTEPVIFYVNIPKTREMLVLPSMASGSGIVAFDRAVRNWLSSPEVLALLPIGYSEVVVYP